jgi:16S rRNA (guanine1207-N2)-methyltransferase
MNKSHARETRVADVMARYMEGHTFQSPLLVINDLSNRLLDMHEGEAAAWNRRAGGKTLATTWPEGGPYQTALLRLPKSKEELSLTLAAARSVLAEDGELFLYGSNDEGIKSATARLEPYFDRAMAEFTKGKCRLLRARSTTAAGRLALSDWQEKITVETPQGQIDLTSYPGIFAHGRLDAGTQVLLDHLPKTSGPVRVLDFGCGSGVLSAALLKTNPEADVTLFDNDALAIRCASQNVPGATARLGSKMADLTDIEVDLILSNPPFHYGKEQDFSALEDLCMSAPKLLSKGGVIRMVVQRTAPAQRFLERAFGSAQVIGENKSFRIWEAG